MIQAGTVRTMQCNDNVIHSAGFFPLHFVFGKDEVKGKKSCRVNYIVITLHCTNCTRLYGTLVATSVLQF